MTLDESELIYDWNETPDATTVSTVEFNDETLRDGLQSPSVIDPAIDTKLRILHLIASLGIRGANLGLPAASERQRNDVSRLAQEIRDQKLQVQPNCAARTAIVDIEPICDIADEVGIPIEVACFIGSSPIRQFAEDWGLDRMLERTAEAVGYATGRGQPVMYVTEDTTRSQPEAIRALYTAAIEHGARRICVCDTVGHSTPRGVRTLLRFVQQVVADTGETVKIDWHGHRDRAMDVANTMAAIEVGADRVHGTALGIGERSGNTPIDLVLVNCALEGIIDNDLSQLGKYCELVSRATGRPIPDNYPVVGPDAFRTATGVHASALIKAQAKGDSWLADRVYSGVPASLVGRRQQIDIGPMSGASNVICWLRHFHIEPTDARVTALIEAAKESDHVLSQDEILAVLAAC